MGKNLGVWLSWEPVGYGLRPTVYMAPSFSWASRVGAVTYSLFLSTLWKSLVAMIEIHYNTLPSFPFGQVSEASMRLQGALFPATARPGDENFEVSISSLDGWYKLRLDAVDDKQSLSSKYLYFLPLAFDPYPETQREDKSNRPHVSDESSKFHGENEPTGGTGSLERDKSADEVKSENKPGLNQLIHHSDEDDVKISGICLNRPRHCSIVGLAALNAINTCTCTFRFPG